MKFLRQALQILVPIAVLVLGWWVAQRILDLQKPPKTTPATFTGPAVRVYTASTADVRIDIDTQGTVEPLQAIDLAAQVGGRIVEVAPALRAGGFFAAGDLLVAIERADFELALAQQRAAVARAELHLLQERAEADAAVRAWRELEGQQPADPLVTRAPQLRDAEAALAAAKAQLARAELDLTRTRVLAPFAGRVRSARADVGQLVQPGQMLAQIYGIEFAEVRLPIPATEAAFLDLPMHGTDGATAPATTPVELQADFAGERHTWTGTLVRTEGEVDRRTRQLMLVARVAAPYARDAGGTRPPLAVGMFVQARVQGRTFAAVVALPRAALHGDREVWVLDAENRLQRRAVVVLRAEADRVLLRSGVVAGERVCVTPLELPTDGMPVRPTDADATAPAPVTPQQGR